MRYTCAHMHSQVLAVAAVALMFSWQSKGVTISDLDSGSFNVRNRLYSYMGLGLLSIGHSIGLIGLGIGGVRLPPSLVRPIVRLISRLHFSPKSVTFRCSYNVYIFFGGGGFLD